MTPPPSTQQPGTAAETRTKLLAILIVVQALCAAFFLVDAVSDFRELGLESVDLSLYIEMTATLSLIVAIGFETQLLLQLLRREAHLERGFSIAAGALHDVMEGYFTSWGLTPAERDVATYLIKGCEIAEIARLRGSAEGTVKAHLNAIYRKADVSGRAALVSILIEDLMGQPLIKAPPPLASSGQ